MKKNSNYLSDDEIDFSYLVRVLWKDRILILLISIVLGLSGFFLSLYKIKNIAEFTIKDPPRQIFDFYNTNTNTNTNFSNVITTSNIGKANNELYTINFNLNLLSLSNLESFVEQSREFDDFKLFLKSKNISVKQYFKIEGNFGQVKEKEKIILNKYYFTLPKELDGNIFIKNYIEFIKEKTIDEHKKILKLELENKLTKFENSLQIAMKIQQGNSSAKSITREGFELDGSADLYNNSQAALSEQIVILKLLQAKLDKDKFSHNALLDITLTEDKPKFFGLVGFFLGLFFSLMIIILRSVLKEQVN
jgi:LPS O-antigen subunit length determinant protein (WzzB/FepE family)